MNREKKITGNIIKTIVLPGCLFAIFAAISVAQGNSFLSLSMIVYLLTITCITAIISMATSLLLMNGALDFSLGAIMYLSVIIGSNLAENSSNPWLMLVITVCFAVVFALINGILHIFLKLPTLTISLAMVLVYEALTQIVFAGSGANIIDNQPMADLVKSPTVFVIFIICAVTFWFLLKYTTFGFNARALARGQKVAVSFGVKERKNVIIRFLIIGLLLGVGATLYLSNILTMPSQRYIGSVGVLFDAMLTAMIGLPLAKYSNLSIGLFVSVLSFKIIYVGFTCMGLNGTLASIITGIFLLMLIVVTDNFGKFVKHIQDRKRKRELTKSFAE